MALPGGIRIVIRTVRQFDDDGAAQMGAALSYYALFSTAPLLVVAVMLAGAIFGREAAFTRVQLHLTEVVGPESAKEVTRLMDAATRPAGGTLAAVLGIGTLVFGALGIFLHLRRCLNAIWRLDPPVKNTVLATLINYALAVVMVICVAVLLLLSLGVSAIVPAMRNRVGEDFLGGAAAWHWLEAGVSLVLLTLFFLLVFRVMSAHRIAWRYAWTGALVTALLFTVGKVLIGLYLAHTSMASAYGTAGSLVVFLIWVYYSSQIIFFGAELIQALRTRAQWMQPADGPSKRD